ncbi:hypothetical protein J6590_005897 [Homalodisca vitripennis]|nr:hypothetical protein J6590_005897 [Homalodisca vitripennis]
MWHAPGHFGNCRGKVVELGQRECSRPVSFFGGQALRGCAGIRTFAEQRDNAPTKASRKLDDALEALFLESSTAIRTEILYMRRSSRCVNAFNMFRNRPINVVQT